jgi:hypothetical protein
VAVEADGEGDGGEGFVGVVEDGHDVFCVFGVAVESWEG